jgi:hypothetical protein
MEVRQGAGGELRASAIKAAERRRSEPTCLSSASDDDAGGFKGAMREQLKKRWREWSW